MSQIKTLQAIGDDLRRAAAGGDAAAVAEAIKKRHALIDQITTPSPAIMDVIRAELAKDAQALMQAQSQQATQARDMARARSGYLQQK